MDYLITNNITVPHIITDNNIYINGDCDIELDKIKDKTIQTVCIDPPYNIGKDTWDNIENYIEYMIKIIKKLELKMKDNGSFFIFHSDMGQMSELLVEMKRTTHLIFRQMIVWNKRFDNCYRKEYLDGFLERKHLYKWNQMAEYILFFTFDNSYKLKRERKKRKIKQTVITREILSKNGKITGWYSNHETGKNVPTRESIIPIKKHLGLDYDDIVPKYNNMHKHHSVWNYSIAKKCPIHITPKPIELLKNIIYHTTDEGDIILDCFAGSGSMGLACKETNRKCILIEKEKKYYDYFIEKLC